MCEILTTDAHGAPRGCVRRHRGLPARLGGGRVRVLASARAGAARRSRDRARADRPRRAGGARAPAPVRPPPRAAPAPLRVRDAGAGRGARAVALRAARPAPSTRVVRGRYAGRRCARRARVPHRHMKRLFADMNPTLRGFLLLLVLTGAIVALRLESSLSVLLAVLRILFIIAIAFFVYLLWRERRGEIATWSLRARAVFYGAAALMLVDLGVEWWYGSSGLETLAFVGVLVLCGFAMWRVWRDQDTWV